MDILVFGTGKCAEEQIKKIKPQINVVGFLDNDEYKHGKEFYDKRIFSPNEIMELQYDYIYICSSYYKDIIKQLLSMQIPMQKIIINEMEEKNILYSIYNSNLPNITTNKENNYVAEKVVNLQHNLLENSVIINVPLELVFTEDIDLVNKSRHKKEQLNKEQIEMHDIYKNIPINCLKPHMQIYNYLFNRGDTLDKYNEWYKITYGDLEGNGIEKNIIMQYDKFSFYREQLEKGKLYFEENPIEVEYNENGYFNIYDGHHRAMFLYANGFRLLPVKMSMGDYVKWINGACILETITKINQFKKLVEEKLYTPILHPYFVNEKVHRDGSSSTRFDKIISQIDINALRKCKTIDVGSAQGYMTRAFRRLGVEISGIDINEKHIEIANQINTLEKVDVLYKHGKFEDDEEKYDIAIMLTVFYHYIGNETSRRNILEKLNNDVKMAIIWESGDDSEYEKAIIQSSTKFKKYYKLGNSIGTGKVRELGVFYIPGAKI